MRIAPLSDYESDLLLSNTAFVAFLLPASPV
jgi:hypothetical protein